MALKLRTKLLFGFIIVALIGAGIGVFGVINLNMARTSLDTMYNNNTLAISNLVYMKSYFMEARLYATKLSMVKTAAEAEDLAD